MKKIVLLLSIFILCAANLVNAQGFGKNRVQYTTFEWQYLQSKHFDVYFYEGGKAIAEFVAEVAETSYIGLKNDLRYELVDRITIIVYKGHNDFQQTNVSGGIPEESVGGFTEFFKNRVVLPFEGDYEKLRHVVHHELTHAVFLQMIYGAGMQSIITGMMRLQLPLWLIEGLAEYASIRWDTESDMFMRDAALSGYLPPIGSISGFLNYKAGQNILFYLAEKYGPEKISEIFGKIKMTKSVERGFRQSIGIGLEDLSKRWQKYVRKEYWPDIANREEAEDFAKRMTDHSKTFNFINNSPTLSPQGDKIAFLSDRTDYFDIYLMSAIDGKILSRLVKGQQTMDLEELHWLQPGMSWSPDGKKLAFAAKKGAFDVLHIVNVKKKKIEVSYDFEFDGLYSPAWSPNGEEIAFSAVEDGASDIYVYNIDTNRYRNITNDLFSDLQPSWSPDGEMIAFTSDRGPNIEGTNRKITKMEKENYRNHDIYTINLASQKIHRVTQTEYIERDPTWAPQGNRLAFISDQNGIFNVFVHNFDSNQTYPITNVLTGIFQPFWSKNALVFTSFSQGGYDIFMLKNPDDIKPDSIKLEDTRFIQKLKEGKIATIFDNYRKLDEKPIADQNLAVGDYKSFVFDKNFQRGRVQPKKEKLTELFPDSSKYKLATGEYIVNDYKISMTPDLVYGNTGYSQFFGVQGSMVVALSDVLGDHRINIYSNLFYDIRNSDYQVSYNYLPNQTDFGLGAFHYTYFFLTSYGSVVRDRNFGLSLYLSRPFDRYRRIDLSMTYLGVDRNDVTYGYELYQRRVLVSGLQFVRDTAKWGYTGPVNGQRSMVSFLYSPDIGKTSLDFQTISLDFRKYFRLAREYNFVFRLAGGASFGDNPQRFFLGGMDNWINRKFSQGGLRIDDADDIYFSSFETPLRGTDYYEQIGTKFFLTNIELRFPFIRYFILGVPPMFFSNIRGALFFDMGAAWTDDKQFQMFKTDKGSLLPSLATPIGGFGFGMRVNLGIFLLRYDLAWRTDLTRTYGKPKSYFSLGAEF